jgi:hypothetical protein
MIADQSWWARQDSNLQPIGYEPTALTIELQARLKVLRMLMWYWQLKSAGAPFVADLGACQKPISEQPLITSTEQAIITLPSFQAHTQSEPLTSGRSAGPIVPRSFHVN